MFKINLSTSYKKTETATNHLLTRIYINKTEKRILFEIKTTFYLKLLTTGTMAFLERTKNKITKDNNSENVTHILTLVHSNIVNNDY